MVCLVFFSCLFFTSGKRLGQFWLSSSVLCILLACVLCQSTGDDNEQQEHGHVTLLHGCSWKRGEELAVIAVHPGWVLAVRHAADKDGVGKAASQVTNMQRSESGLKGAAPGRGPRARKVRFAQQSALKDRLLPATLIMPLHYGPFRMCVSVFVISPSFLYRY